MPFDVIDQYSSFVENNFIKSNKEQIRVLKNMSLVWQNYKKTGIFLNSNKKEGRTVHMNIT